MHVALPQPERPQGVALTEHENFLWLAGLIEGEGSFMQPPPSRPNEPRVEIEMKDRDVIARVAALVGAKMQKRVRRKFNPPKTTYRVRIGGARAAALMRRLSPYFCDRRREQIVRALARHTPSELTRWRGRAALDFTLRDVCPTPMCPHLRDACPDHVGLPHAGSSHAGPLHATGAPGQGAPC